MKNNTPPQNTTDPSGRSALVGNVVTGWLSHLVTIITGFFVPRVMDEQLGSAMLGIWDLAWSFVVYFSLGKLGLATSLNRFVSKYRASGDIDKLQVAISTSTIIQVTTATIITVIAGLIAYTLPRMNSNLNEHLVVAQYVIFILGVNVALRFLFETSRNVLNGCHRWDINNKIEAVVNILASGSIIVSLLTGYGLIAASIIYTLFTLLEGLIRSRFLRQVCPEAVWKFSLFSFSFASKLFRFGITVFMMGLAPVIILNSTNILIATTIGVHALAIFARPNALLRFIRTLVTRFTFTLTPMAGPILSKDGPDELRRFLILCTRYGFAFSLPAITLFCLYGGEVIWLWMGPDFVNEAIITILGIGALMPLSQSPMTRILIGLNLHGMIFMRALFFGLAIFGVGLYILLSINASMEEFAFLMSFSLSFMYGIIVPYYACRELELPIRKYLADGFGRVGLLWAVATVPLAVIHGHQLSSSFFSVLIEIVLYCSILATLYWIYLLPKQAKNIIRAKLLGASET